MKKIFVLAIASVILSCDQSQRPEENMPADSISQDSQPVPEPLPDSTVAQFSEEETWLSDLLSDNKEKREATFKRYISVRDTSRSTSEIMTGYIKTYFSTYPKDFLVGYASMKKRGQENVIDDVAYEFRSAGDDYKSYIDEYFRGIRNSCTDCSPSVLNTLKVIKQRIESEVKKSNE